MITDHRLRLQVVKTPADIEWSETRWPRWIGLASVFVASGLCWGAVVFFALTIAALMHGA